VYHAVAYCGWVFSSPDHKDVEAKQGILVLPGETGIKPVNDVMDLFFLESTSVFLPTDKTSICSTSQTENLGQF
jgi:hypothetical protein